MHFVYLDLPLNYNRMDGLTLPKPFLINFGPLLIVIRELLLPGGAQCGAVNHPMVCDHSLMSPGPQVTRGHNTMCDLTIPGLFESNVLF